MTLLDFFKLDILKFIPKSCLDDILKDHSKIKIDQRINYFLFYSYFDLKDKPISTENSNDYNKDAIRGN